MDPREINWGTELPPEFAYEPFEFESDYEHLCKLGNTFFSAKILVWAKFLGSNKFLNKPNGNNSHPNSNQGAFEPEAPDVGFGLRGRNYFGYLF